MKLSTPIATQAVLRAEGLHVGAGKKILWRDLTWQVESGQFWCILGRNGIGKSTLLHTLAGLHTPLMGQVLIQDQDVQTIPARQLAYRRGLLLQQQFDAFSSSVLETVLVARYPYQTGSGWSTMQDHALALQALQQVGMADFAGHDVMHLSGGERQRVALAALLAQDTLLLLLDEPTAHQDPAAQMMVMELLRHVLPYKAVIATCHDVNLVARYATHVLLLGADRYWQGPTDSVLLPHILQAALGCSFQLINSDQQRLFVPLPEDTSYS